MNNSRKKKFLLFAGSTYIFIVGSLIVLIGIVLVIILFVFQNNEPDSLDEQTVRKRPALIALDDPTATPVIEPTDVPEVASDNTTQPVVDIAPSKTLATPTQTIVSAIPTSLGTPSPVAVSGSIRGRVLLDGAPAGGITIRLEDQNLNTIAETIAGNDGTYTFSNLEATDAGYNLVFSREWNTQYNLGQVISWGWVGLVPLADEASVQIPDFDISLLGFQPTAPVPKTSISAASVSPSSPVQFEWAAYPEATKYWVDLVYGQEQTIVWQSSGVKSTSISFEGTLSNNTKIQPGEYRWGVGAQRDLGPYTLTVYGYLPALSIVP